MKKISSKQAHIIAQRLGLDIDGDGTTYYATNTEETEIYSFDTKKERDDFVWLYSLAK